MRASQAELLRLLGTGSNEEYWAIQVLANARGDRAVYGRLLALFRDTAAPLDSRQQALSALCALRPRAKVDLICEAAADRDIAKHSGWLWWIALRDDVVVPLDLCRNGFGADTGHVARAAAGQLALRHGERGRAYLEDVLRAGPPDHRATASLALARFGSREAFLVLLDELVDGRGHRKWQRKVARTVVRHFRGDLLSWAGANPQRLAGAAGLAWAVAELRMAQGGAAAEDVLRSGTPTMQALALRRLAREQGLAPSTYPV